LLKREKELEDGRGGAIDFDDVTAGSSQSHSAPAASSIGLVDDPFEVAPQLASAALAED